MLMFHVPSELSPPEREFAYEVLDNFKAIVEQPEDLRHFFVWGYQQIVGQDTCFFLSRILEDNSIPPVPWFVEKKDGKVVFEKMHECLVSFIWTIPQRLGLRL